MFGMRNKKFLKLDLFPLWIILNITQFLSKYDLKIYSIEIQFYIYLFEKNVKRLKTTLTAFF